ADVPALLRHRLRLLSLGVVAALGYFAALVLVAPREKVGLFLERPVLVALNWGVLLACGVLAGVLWSRRPLSLRRLRQAEAALVGLLLAEMGLGLFSDLVLDEELYQPLAAGDHALFHYASSWSLPFFALIVAYGTLVPSTARRCAAVVAAMVAVPLAISAAAGLAAGLLGPSFLLSFLFQMALWLAAAAGIAAYGAYRVETLRREASAARRVGQYRLARRLGAGGMGEVYLAEHVLLRRPCAVKVIRPEMAGDPGAVGRFEHEARVAAGLAHPNTVQVFDYGVAADGTFYLAMEYVPGPNLDQLVGQHGPLPPGRVVGLLRQACGALAEAHAAGLVHRDVKPSNILVCDRGGVPDVVKLVDFGLAQGAGGSGPVGGRVWPGVFVGTPSYASPEQARGRAEVDARSDIYGLGAVAYFLLTGRLPFSGPTELETLTAIIHDPVARPRSVRPDVPADLEAVVLRCLEKDPAARFPDAAGLERALAGCGSAAG
ncbi:MAG: serine/threonine protein kinase, partial [Gemmataceae bacterium]|nr:serine/threonine protein kinase [Gemmataceae bacterium]